MINKEGEWVLIFENGDRYEGQMKDNDKHGFGKFTFNDKSKYSKKLLVFTPLT